jgi:hypothetical protein
MILHTAINFYKEQIMALHETQGLSGRLTIELRDLNGQLIHRLQQPNLITNGGKKLVAQLFTGMITGKPKLSIVVGDGTQDPKTTDEELGKPLATADISPENDIKISHDRAVAKVTATFNPLDKGKGTQSLCEAGIMIDFPDSQGFKPVLYNHVKFETITRTDNLEMTLTWEVLF